MRKLHVYGFILMFFFSCVLVDAVSHGAFAATGSTSLGLNSSIAPQAPILTLVSAGTVTVTTNSDGSMSATCPSGSILAGTSNNSSLVYMYNSTGKATPTTCYRAHTCASWEAGCWCAGFPNDCCLGCNYQESYTCYNYSPSGAWGSRSALPSGTNTNAPDIITNGTCYYPVVTWTPAKSVPATPASVQSFNIPQT